MGDSNLTVFLISDSTGKTAKTVIDSVAIQFDIEELDIRNFSDVNSIDRLTEIIAQAQNEENVVIAYTLVLPELCEYLEAEAEQVGIPALDILGPFLTQFSQILNKQPQLEVGLSYQHDKKSFNKLSCLEFAVRCDDGKNINKLKSADIILLGVSRTSKTPISRYLAYENYKVANVSLSPEVLPPEEIYELPPEKIFGLTIEPELLQKIRQERLKSMRFSAQSGYGKLERIQEELTYAEEIMEQLGCRIIDISHTAIEEIAAEILTDVR